MNKKLVQKVFTHHGNLQPLTLLLLGMLVLFSMGLSGCKIGKPFRGPGYDPDKGVMIENRDMVIISLTHAVTGKDDHLNEIFIDYVWKVEASLKEFPGFVGYSIRKELFGNVLWTMTVCED